ncbi:MAG: GNAT family N-acetyltransferase [Candidatus Hodarchaeota archaeon]
MKIADEEILVREMKESDIEFLANIDRDISEEYRPEIWKSEMHYYLGKPESICLVAETQGRVIGFMIGTIHPWLFGIEKAGWIEILGVDPVHRGKGIGKKLGETLFDNFKSKGVKMVHTAVNWTSGDLLEFFKTLGMDRSGLITLMKGL